MGSKEYTQICSTCQIGWNNFADICLVRVPEEARRCQNLQRTSSRIYFPYLVAITCAAHWDVNVWA